MCLFHINLGNTWEEIKILEALFSINLTIKMYSRFMHRPVNGVFIMAGKVSYFFQFQTDPSLVRNRNL